ncbi:octaprenyl-diphosphate synthase [Roseimicrobium gellanilyticum]|uniref:Octaprenyl-diphosphate synthase n=1 Tax=Roseimicrobium gellanilyticum TaxID=748857 RepID=A0A366HG59_9BACT|nr:polyprenyl synthetase family protein [Roseimicrobium gellanilyticum]RBP41498.1 octaprenyl-diphosphate synthase [Roseimicrobium gellanilyticum]
MKLPSFLKPKAAFPFELVKPEVDHIEQILQEQARAFDPAVEGYVSYVCNTSGKRIRPALAVLAGGATGGVSDDHRRLSVILEMVHIASLVHDDIMDGATLRREVPTAAAKWGNALSVLLGDSLFAYALELATEFADSGICRRIARASRDVACGEILQTQRRFDFNLSLQDYFRIIEMKTAALFAAATELGAKLNGQSDELVASMESYGLKLGTAYQIYDDCIDLVGDEKAIGKTLGTDLAKGKLTLPMLYLLQDASEQQRIKLQRMVLKGEPMDTSILAGIADYAGAIDRSVRTAREMLEDARKNLVGLPATVYKDAMVTVTQYLDGLLDQCKAA